MRTGGNAHCEAMQALGLPVCGAMQFQLHTCSMKPERHVIMPGRMRLLRPSKAWLPSSDSTIMMAWDIACRRVKLCLKSLSCYEVDDDNHAASNGVITIPPCHRCAGWHCSHWSGISAQLWSAASERTTGSVRGYSRCRLSAVQARLPPASIGRVGAPQRPQKVWPCSIESISKGVRWPWPWNNAVAHCVRLRFNGCSAERTGKQGGAGVDTRRMPVCERHRLPRHRDLAHFHLRHQRS